MLQIVQRRDFLVDIFTHTKRNLQTVPVLSKSLLKAMTFYRYNRCICYKFNVCQRVPLLNLLNRKNSEPIITAEDNMGAERKARGAVEVVEVVGGSKTLYMRRVFGTALLM